MSTFNEADHPRGHVKNPGAFVEKQNSAPNLSALVTADSPVSSRDQLLARREALRELGYIPAGSGISETTPRSTAGIKKWWVSHFVRGEYAPNSYHQMPDDFTPGMTSGRALSGHRRTYRKLYQGAGVAVRMPSATAIRAFSSTINDQTFDVPIEIEHKDGVHTGFVRVSKLGPNTWEAQAVNFPEKAGLRASEAVTAVLESRSPSTALSQIGSLYQHHRERMSRAGAKPATVRNSTFISRLGYNPVTEEMVVGIAHRTYGYKVPKKVFESLASSTAPGVIYNQLVRNKAPKFTPVKCGRCGRYYRDDAAHRCVGVQTSRTRTQKVYNERARAAAIGG